jgi:hypothetical protein
LLHYVLVETDGERAGAAPHPIDSRAKQGGNGAISCQYIARSKKKTKNDFGRILLSVELLLPGAYRYNISINIKHRLLANGTLVSDWSLSVDGKE